MQLDRTLRILHPVFADVAERLHDVDELRIFAVDAAFLARLHVGGQRLAALFDHAGKVLGELLEVEGRRGLRRCGHGDNAVDCGKLLTDMAADRGIRQRADIAALFKAAKNSVDEPEREYRLPGIGSKPGYHHFFVLRPAAFGDQFDPVSKYHSAIS